MFDSSKWLFFFKCSEFCSTVSVLVAISWRNFRLKTFDDIISSPSSIFSAYDSNARAQNGERLFFSRYFCCCCWCRWCCWWCLYWMYVFMSVIFKLKRVVKIILTRMITLLKCISWYIWIQTHIKIALRSLYLSAHDIFRRDILFQVSIILSRSLDYETSICNLIDIFLVRADFCACIRLGGKSTYLIWGNPLCKLPSLVTIWPYLTCRRDAP